MPDLIATAAFGLEAVVDRELDRLGYSDRVVEDGKVTFAADEGAIARTNLWLRSSDRVLVQIAEFNATEFGGLFDQIVALAWEDWLPRDAAIPVEVRAIRSPIRSPRSAQSIVKKAIVTRLAQKYGIATLPEDGPRYPVDVAIRGDEVTVAIDTSGDALHKRGYRTRSGPAPLKETLAAGLIQLSYWNRDRPFADPFCGSGTVPIEAALIGRNLAPGLNRTFLAEQWPRLRLAGWKDARDEARDLAVKEAIAPLFGSDLDEKAVEMARGHALSAGVADDVAFETMALRDFTPATEFGCLVSNPPYGERLGDERRIGALYRSLNDLFGRIPSWSVYFLTAYPDFERLVVRRPDRKRKLYNGRIECTYHQFFGPRPPKERGRRPGGGDGVDEAASAPHDNPSAS